MTDCRFVFHVVVYLSLQRGRQSAEMQRILVLATTTSVCESAFFLYLLHSVELSGCSLLPWLSRYFGQYFGQQSWLWPSSLWPRDQMFPDGACYLSSPAVTQPPQGCLPGSLPPYSPPCLPEPCWPMCQVSDGWSLSHYLHAGPHTVFLALGCTVSC